MKVFRRLLAGSLVVFFGLLVVDGAGSSNAGFSKAAQVVESTGRGESASGSLVAEQPKALSSSKGSGGSGWVSKLASRFASARNVSDARMLESVPLGSGDNFVSFLGEYQGGFSTCRGCVDYAGVDMLGRAGRVSAFLTREMVDGSVRKETLEEPSGWGFNREVMVSSPGGSYRGWFWNRSHLLADSLGGDGSAANLVTGTRMQNVGFGNVGGMAYPEGVARKFLKDFPSQGLRYEVTPVFVGGELVPRYVLVDLLSEDGRVNMRVKVDNVMPGFAIDYSSGVFYED